MGVRSTANGVGKRSGHRMSGSANGGIPPSVNNYLVAGTGNNLVAGTGNKMKAG